MTKNVTISFRTNDDLRKALEKVSEQERRTVSSTIENILYAYFEDGKMLKQAKEERRQHPRKTLDAPALIGGLVPDSKDDLNAGIVLNISVGGLQVSVPSNCQYEIKEGKEDARISVVFTLPHARKPLAVQCVPQHIHRINGETNIGASFSDGDVACFQAIRSYLIN